MRVCSVKVISIVLLLAAGALSASVPADAVFSLAPGEFVLNPGVAPAPPAGTDIRYDTLHFDGGNATGVGMSGGGWFKAGVRLTTPFRCILKSLLFYQYDYALVGYFFLYGPRNDTAPGALWDSLQYIPGEPGGWVRTDLPEDRFLNANTDFWVCPEFACGPNRYPMGVDSGPLVWNRNFIYWTVQLGWVHLPRVGLNSNWNVRAIVMRADWRDVGATEVVSPSGQVWPGPLTPKVRVRNYGELPESNIPVTVWIDSAGTRVYGQSAVLAGPLGRGEHGVVELPPWHPGPVDAEYTLTAFTHLAGDENYRNDTVCAVARVAGAAFTDTIFARRVQGRPPSIDGDIRPEEWAAALAYDISDTAGQGLTPREPGSNIVRFLYDDGFLYLACEFPTVNERADGDFFALCTDEDLSGTWNRPDSCEGRHTFLFAGNDSVIFDAILTTLPYVWRLPGQCPDAFSASGASGGRLQFEAKVPFGSRRGDLEIAPGDTAGVFMYSMANYGSDCYGWWPQRVTQGNWADPARYSPLILDTSVDLAEPQPGLPVRSITVLPSLVTSRCAVSYRLARPGPARLAVYDRAGALVRTLSKDAAPAGRVNWDCTSERGGRVAAGVYFVRLTTDTGPASIPLVVLD